MTSENSILLETEGLTKKYGRFLAVDSVDFAVERGETRCVIGPNGAGKTTFFNLLTGTLPVSDGRIIYKGDDITSEPAYKIARRSIARSQQVTTLFPNLTVIENVLGGLKGKKPLQNPIRNYMASESDNAKAMEILSSLDIDDLAQKKVSELSQADKKMLDLAVALSMDPVLLLLDEPTAGLSSKGAKTIEQTIADLDNEITTIIIEHNVEMVLNLADKITVLHNGQILVEGTPDEIQNNERVQEVYFGGGI